MPEGMLAFKVTEQRRPMWTWLMPAVYFLAAAGCVVTKLRDPSADVGVQGALVAVGFVAVWAVPGVFTSRSARVSVSERGLRVDGRALVVHEATVEPLSRGAATLRVRAADGLRTFVFGSYADAQRVLQMLAPVAAPATA
jgi:membrane protein YdbS with pleckstrin-like domain